MGQFLRWWSRARARMCQTPTPRRQGRQRAWAVGAHASLCARASPFAPSLPAPSNRGAAPLPPLRQKRFWFKTFLQNTEYTFRVMAENNVGFSEAGVATYLTPSEVSPARRVCDSAPSANAGLGAAFSPAAWPAGLQRPALLCSPALCHAVCGRNQGLHRGKGLLRLAVLPESDAGVRQRHLPNCEHGAPACRRCLETLQAAAGERIPRPACTQHRLLLPHVSQCVAAASFGCTTPADCCNKDLQCVAGVCR